MEIRFFEAAGYPLGAAGGEKGKKTVGSLMELKWQGRLLQISPLET